MLGLSGRETRSSFRQSKPKGLYTWAWRDLPMGVTDLPRCIAKARDVMVKNRRQIFLRKVVMPMNTG
jgi:hypothetical protein